MGYVELCHSLFNAVNTLDSNRIDALEQFVQSYLVFLGCDLNVLFYNVLPVTSAFHITAIVLMWLFYLPAQTLLALSASERSPMASKNMVK